LCLFRGFGLVPSHLFFFFFLFEQVMATISIPSLLSACIDLSQRAGHLIHKVHSSGNLNVIIKGVTSSGVDDPLTEADLQSQKLIIGGLRNVWKGLHIIGEEDCEVPDIDLVPSLTLTDKYQFPAALQNVNIDDVIVYIDPLDATREFTLGNVHCVITLIGIAIKGLAMAGVMHQPFVGPSGRTVWGAVGLGVVGLHSNDDDTPTTTIPQHNADKVRLVTTASHNSAAVDEAIRKIKPDEVIRAGGAGYKVLMLLDSKADVYVYPTSGCKLWDTCAPHALVSAVGGTMTDSFGNNITYFANSDVQARKGILVALKNHDVFLAKLHETVN